MVINMSKIDTIIKIPNINVRGKRREVITLVSGVCEICNEFKEMEDKEWIRLGYGLLKCKECEKKGENKL